MTGMYRLSTRDIPPGLREPNWADVLAKLELRYGGNSIPVLDETAGATVSCSTRQSLFVRLNGNSQTLCSQPRDRIRSGSTMLVLTVLEGTMQVLEHGVSEQLGRGGIILLNPDQDWQLLLSDNFRAMAIRLESTGFLLRLVRSGRAGTNRIHTDHGVGALCLDLIHSIAGQLENLGAQELTVIETNLSEMLITALSRETVADVDDNTNVQLLHLRRLCGAIDGRLGDPDLNIDQIAEQEGLSTRYLQKLFRNSGTTFSEYVKHRRVQHCCLDLVNPALDGFSIAEICFRWGFNDAGNFSRVFSQIMKVSPRAYRASPPPDPRQHLHRGQPHSWLHTGPHPESAGGNHLHKRQQPFRDLLHDHTRYALSLHLAPKRIATTHRKPSERQNRPEHYYLPASDRTVHWGYFSRDISPVLTICSGDIVTVETLSQHASDDWERMIAGDPGAEAVFHWTADRKNVDRRGAGPMDASVCGRGAGEGFGVHICTGPIYIRDAEPGDVLEVRILDIQSRPSCHADHEGRCFGSNAATWWGFHYHDMLTEPKKREVVTIYEVYQRPAPHARAVYNFRWTPQTDPFGVRHETIDYPGVPVDHDTVHKNYGVLQKARIPVRPHFGVLAVAPREGTTVDSIPPSYFGGNLDNWRAGKGSSLFLPVSVKGALFSVGDPHASQGDSELCGTAIECSLTGVFQLVVHKRTALQGRFLENLSHPFLETPEEWVIQGLSFADYQAELGAKAQTQVYKDSSMESAMRDAFRKTRHYLMTEHQLTEDEAISLMSVAVDFGITQVVDGNIGVHAVIRKSVFPDWPSAPPETTSGQQSGKP